MNRSSKRNPSILVCMLSILFLLSELATPIPAAANPDMIQVTSLGDSGSGTLRQALLDAQAGDTITFSPSVFPPGSPATIQPRSPLPSLSKANLTVDASNAGVILDGSRAGAGANGLILSAGGCSIWGLAIQNFSSNAVILEPGASGNHIGGDRGIGSGPHGRGNRLSGNGGSGVDLRGAGTDGNWIQGNWIGVDYSGWNAQANSFNGVAIWQGARNNTIGGSTPGERNVVSGNTQNGIWIGGVGTDGNVVSGNYIGTRLDGQGAVPNGYSGVAMQDGARYNRIGGGSAGQGNLISGNTTDGIYLSGAGTDHNAILGNLIGPDAGGNFAIGQGMHGVILTGGASFNQVGDGTAGGRNLLSGNSLDGVLIEGAGTQGNTVLGNYAGTNLAGSLALPNGLHGVDVARQAHDNQVGGDGPGQGNLLSGNSNHGLVMISGAHHNTAAGNIIGPDATGTYFIGNHPNGGVDIADGAHDNLIGGSTAGAGNLISGNPTDGIALFNSVDGGPATTNNRVIGNFIGTTLGGNSPLPNQGDGVFNVYQATGTLIQGNRIAYNKSFGVRLTECSGNLASQNSIYANGSGGVVNEKNCPPAPALSAASTTHLSGATVPNARVEFFSDDAGQGRVYEGFTTADSAGIFSFDQAAGFAGPNVTATSTAPGGTTSAFSTPVRLMWTVLLYLNGDNDLDEAMFDTLDNLAASHGQIANVLALVDGEINTPSTANTHPGTALYDLTTGRTPIAATLGLTRTVPGELDMGDGGTLSDFVAWGRAHSPSKYTLLAIVDHGGGWAPSPIDGGPGAMPIHRRSFLAGGSGLSWDFSSDYDYLDSPEIRQALKTSTQDGAKPLDVLFYDVCLMGMLEVADQVQEYAGYFVSSQNIGWAPVGPQGRYVRVVAGITPATTPRGMAQLLVQSYADSLPPNEHPFTVSAVDMGKLPALVGAVDQLGLAISATLAGPNPPLALLHGVYASSQKVDYDSDFAIEPATDGFVDLYDFAGRASNAYTAFPTVKAAADAVKAALGQALVAEQHRSGSPWMALDRRWDLDGAHGLSIFLPLGEDLQFNLDRPDNPSGGLLRLREVYSSGQLRFVASTSWRGLIERYYELAASGVPTEVAGGPAQGLLPPDVTPPQSAVALSGQERLGQGLTLTWSAADSQSGVAGASLWVRIPAGAWADTGLVQDGASGQFLYPQTAACGTSMAVRSRDAAGNLEPPEHGANTAVVQRNCFVFIPWMGR